MSDMAPTSNMQDSSTLAEAEAEAADSVEAVTNLCSEVSPPATPVLQSSLLPPPPPLQRCGGPPALKASPAAALAGRKLHTSSPPSLTVSPSLQPSQLKIDKEEKERELIIELIQKDLSLQEQVKILKKKLEVKEAELRKANLTSVQLWKLLMQEHKNSLRKLRNSENSETSASASVRKQKKSEKKKKKIENDRSKEKDKEERRQHRRSREEKAEITGDWREYRRWCKKIDQKMNADWADYVTEYERRIAEQTEEDERRVARNATEDDSSEQGEDDEDRESQDEDQEQDQEYQEDEDQEYQDQDQEYQEDEECGDEDVGEDEGEKYDERCH